MPRSRVMFLVQRDSYANLSNLFIFRSTHAPSFFVGRELFFLHIPQKLKRAAATNTVFNACASVRTVCRDCYNI